MYVKDVSSKLHTIFQLKKGSLTKWKMIPVLQ